MRKRIVFTGGSGKAGKHVVPYLLGQGYEVLNLDLRPLDHPGVHTLITDVADGGQVFNALTSHVSMAGFEKAEEGVRKIVIASSETTYGVCFADGDKDYACFPLEEDYAVDPMDSYGLSKVVNERTAHAFALRSGADIYALRIGNIIEPQEYDRSSMPSTTRSRRSCRRPSSWRATRPAFRSGGRSRSSMRRSATARSVTSSASARSTIGEST